MFWWILNIENIISLCLKWLKEKHLFREGKPISNFWENDPPWIYNNYQICCILPSRKFFVFSLSCQSPWARNVIASKTKTTKTQLMFFLLYKSSYSLRRFSICKWNRPTLCFGKWHLSLKRKTLFYEKQSLSHIQKSDAPSICDNS